MVRYGLIHSLTALSLVSLWIGEAFIFFQKYEGMKMMVEQGGSWGNLMLGISISIQLGTIFDAIEVVNPQLERRRSPLFWGCLIFLYFGVLSMFSAMMRLWLKFAFPVGFLMPIYFHPWYFIASTAINRNKNCFFPPFQVHSWIWPSLLPMYFRGTLENHFRLTPARGLCWFIFVQTLLATFVSYRQFVKSPLWFVPRRFRPKQFQYKKKLSEVPADKLDDDCPICFGPLREPLNPVPLKRLSEELGLSKANSNKGSSEGIELKEQLLEPENSDPPPEPSIFGTPCNHYYHEECLILWMNSKNVCPICRTTLPLYLKEDEED